MKKVSAFIAVVASLILLAGSSYAAGYPEPLYDNGVDLAAQGKFAEAREVFDQVRKEFPNYSPVKTCLRVLDDFATKKIEVDDALDLFQGTAAANRMMTDPAIAIFDRVITRQPNYDIAYLSRGLALADKGKFDMAAADFSRAVEINPKNGMAYSNRGFAHSVMNQMKNAMDDFNKALEVDPTLLEAMVNRGLLYMMKGEPDLACTDWKMACEYGECTNYNIAVIDGSCF